MQYPNPNIEKLSEYMKLRGMDKTSLAKAANLSRSTVYALFRGNDVSMLTVLKVMRALNIPKNQAGTLFFAPKITRCVSSPTNIRKKRTSVPYCTLCNHAMTAAEMYLYKDGIAVCETCYYETETRPLLTVFGVEFKVVNQ